MEFRQLEYFVAAAEELHFQRAARRVGITQPSLSSQVKQLEEELGTTLLERDRRSVSLTPAGETLLHHARQLLRDRERAYEEIRDAAGLEKLILKIGTRFFIGLPLFTQSIVATRKTNPKIQIEQIDMPTNEVPDAVKEGLIDIGFAVAPVTIPSLVVKPIKHGRFVIVLPTEHPLAAADEVGIPALTEQPMIFFDRALNPVLFGSCLEHFEAAGVSPKIVMETNQVANGLSMVKDGLGALFVADYVVENLDESLVAIPIQNFPPISVVAVWHEDNRSKALKTYLTQLRTLVR